MKKIVVSLFTLIILSCIPQHELLANPVYNEIQEVNNGEAEQLKRIVEADLDGDGSTEIIYARAFYNSLVLTIYSTQEGIDVKDEVCLGFYNDNPAYIYIVDNRYIVAKGPGTKDDEYIHFVFEYQDKEITLTHYLQRTEARYHVKYGDDPSTSITEAEYNQFTARFDPKNSSIWLYNDNLNTGEALESNLENYPASPYANGASFYIEKYENTLSLIEHEGTLLSKTFLYDLDEDGAEELIMFRAIKGYDFLYPYMIHEGYLCIYDAKTYSKSEMFLTIAYKREGVITRNRYSRITITDDNIIYNAYHSSADRNGYYDAYLYANGLITAIDSTSYRYDIEYMYASNNYKEFVEQYNNREVVRYLFNNSLQEPKNIDDGFPAHDLVKIYGLQKGSAWLEVNGVRQNQQISLINGVSFMGLSQLQAIDGISVQDDGEKIKIIYENNTLEFVRGTNKYTLNDQSLTLADNTMHYTADSIFYVPLGVTMRSLGFEVGWDANTYTATVTSD